jgi:hypothetical protein
MLSWYCVATTRSAVLQQVDAARIVGSSPVSALLHSKARPPGATRPRNACSTALASS